MEAVLAHELTHIIDRDCRLLIVTIVFTGMISFLAQMLWRSLRVASYSRGSSRKSGGAILLLMLIAAIALMIGYVLALILRFAISRRREFLADAGSVELTKNPDALISALLKIADNPEVPHVPTEVRQMFIENPPSGFRPWRPFRHSSADRRTYPCAGRARRHRARHNEPDFSPFDGCGRGAPHATRDQIALAVICDLTSLHCRKQCPGYIDS